jgi:hypothetical protein
MKRVGSSLIKLARVWVHLTWQGDNTCHKPWRPKHLKE